MEENKRLTRKKAIRAKCIDCMCGNTAEVRRCPSKNCSLWPYRMGKEERVVSLPSEDA